MPRYPSCNSNHEILQQQTAVKIVFKYILLQISKLRFIGQKDTSCVLIYLVVKLVFQFLLDYSSSFLKHYIGGGPPDSADVETLRLELAQVNERNKELEDEVSILKLKVCIISYFIL